MPLHSGLTAIHRSQAAEYANTTARDAVTYSASDVGKIYRTTDSNTFWLLKHQTGPVFQALGGGGGGGGVILEGGTSFPVPIQTNEYDTEVFKFTNGGTESVYWRCKLPNSYTAGTQVFLYLTYYSPDTSNTLLISSTSYLKRPATDAASSVANSYTSTNAAVTLSGASELLRTVVLDISNASGQINSVALAAGQDILVRIFRGTDTSTSDARIVARSGDPKFSA